MRNLVLLLAFMMPPLVACGAAYAKTSADIGKPICAHYDDATKPVQHAIVAVTTPATAATTIATSSTTASPVPATTIAGNAAANQQAKGGGTSGMRQRGAPHWQTFLPGMFK